MITRNQEKLIKTLHTKNGRLKNGLCLVEGQKVIDTAGDAIEYTFTPQDTDIFNQLVTTETPQEIAAVAKIPQWSIHDVTKHNTVVVLDGVQDPGNVGAILRLCLGFDAGLLLVESADVTNPKVVRSSVGAMFQVPWLKLEREQAPNSITELKRTVYRLETQQNSQTVAALTTHALEPIILIAGSEGHGISLPITGTSLRINHELTLESLNVTHALAILLWYLHTNR